MTVRQCCVCKKVEKGGEWVKVDQLKTAPTSTYCPPCLKEHRGEIKKEQDLAGRQLRGTGQKMTSFAV